MVLRFSTEECRYNCFDYICYKLNRPLFTLEEIVGVDNFMDTIALFTKKGFIVKGYIDNRLLINPHLLIYKVFSSIVKNKSILYRFDSRSVILYYLSGNELYGVDEIWTHCICEYLPSTYIPISDDSYTIDEGGACLSFSSGREIFDSYYKELNSHYLFTRYPNHERLVEMVNLAIILSV